MNLSAKSKEELFLELETLRARIADLEQHAAEHREAEEALRQSEARYRGLYEAITGGIVVQDKTGAIVEANAAACEILGLTPGQIRGRTSVDPRWNAIREDGTPFPGNDHPAMVTLRTGQPLRTVVMGVYHPRAREYRWMLLNSEPIFDPATNQLEKVASTFVDITDHKRAEEALRASLDRCRSYIDVTGQLGWTTNAEGEIVEDVPSFRKFTGQTYEEVQGWGWIDALHKDDVKHTEEVWKKAVTSKGQYEVEYRIRRHDGVYRHFMARGMPVFEEKGERIREWVGACIDITERKNLEKELSWQAETRAALADVSKALLSPEKSIEDISDIVHEYAKRLTDSKYGFAAYAEPKTGDEICPTLTRDVWEECQVQDRSVVFRRISAKDGLTGWVWENRKSLMTNNPSDDPRSRGVPKGHVPIRRFLCAPAVMGQEFLGMVAVANSSRDYAERDLMLVERLAALYALAIERIRSEQALQESERKYRQLVDSLLEGIWVIDKDAYTTYVNPAMAKMLGYGVGEMLGKHLFSFMDEMSIESCKRLLERRRQGIEEEHEFEFIRKDGSRVYTRMMAGPITNNEGDFVGALACVADITARKQAEDDLRESEARYRRLSESLEETVKKQVAELRQAQTLAALGQMVSVVAHEIRNPLHTINLGTYSLQKAVEQGEEKSEISEIIKEITYGSKLMNSVVNELLHYARPVRLECLLWPIRDIAVQALGMVAHKLHKISVHLDLDQTEIFVDAEKMIRVLVNLISNSADAMPNGGELRISSQCCEWDGRSVLRLCVSDTGCGISEELVEQVQEPFFTTKARGAGLGLSVCKKIIEAHKGSLSITSKVNEGTAVEIMLSLNNI